MMDKFKQEAYKLRLTSEEKAAMKRQIFASPVDGLRPRGLSAPAVSTASPYFFFDMQFMQRSFVPLLAALVVLGGTGTAYAAEGALPGDALYTVKVHVTEPLRVVLAVTPEDRAEAHIAIAQKRVEEAEALSMRGTLTATTTGELEANMEEHLATAGELALEVGQSDQAAALEIEARTRSVLSVRGAILASRGAESKDEESKNNSRTFARRILARAEVADATGAPTSNTARSMAFIATPAPDASEPAEVVEVQTPSTIVEDTSVASGTLDSETTSVADVHTTVAPAPHKEEDEREESRREARLKERAEDAKERAEREYRDIKKNLAAEALLALDAQFKTLEALIEDRSYTETIRLAVKLQSILEAQSKYRGDVITPLLNLHLDINLDRQ